MSTEPSPAGGRVFAYFEPTADGMAVKKSTAPVDWLEPRPHRSGCVCNVRIGSTTIAMGQWVPVRSWRRRRVIRRRSRFRGRLALCPPTGNVTFTELFMATAYFVHDG